MTQKIFFTEYYCNDTLYGSFVYANSFEEANEFVKKRGLGEVVTGFNGNVDEVRDLTNCINRFSMLDSAKQAHFLCFVAHIAMTGFGYSSDELFSDEGLIHNFWHKQFGSNTVAQVECLIREVFNKEYDYEDAKPGTEKIEFEKDELMKRIKKQSAQNIKKS